MVPDDDLSVLLSGQFFDVDETSRLCAAMRVGARDPSKVGGETGEYVLRLDTRNTNHVSVDNVWKVRVRERLAELKPRLEERFRRPLGVLQKPRFLSYSAGQYFRPHRDRLLGPLQPRAVVSRSVSIVVLLNPGDYEGGRLILHDMGVSGSKLEVKGRRGGFVAFHPSVLHEVTEVSAGERYSLATWFEEPLTKV